MKGICVIAVVALITVASLSLLSQEKEDGAQLFKSRCASCHGDKGEGKPDVNMPAVKGTSMSAEKLATYILKGESGRTIHADPLGGISEEQAKLIAEFVKTLK